MRTKDLFKVNRSAKRINESIEKVFGKKLNLESFDLDQLQDARNKLRTQLSQQRSSSGFNENIENEAYTRAQWMLDAINAEISHREEFIVDSVEQELDEEPQDPNQAKAYQMGHAAQKAGNKDALNTIPQQYKQMWIKGWEDGENLPKEDVEQVDESKGSKLVQNLVDKFYDDNGIEWSDGNVYVKEPGTRVWTRGDGVRYRDPGKITTKDGSDTKQLKAFFPWLTKQPGVKHLGKLSGSFASEEPGDVYAIGGIYFKLVNHGIVEWGSVSRFKNPRSVWKQQPNQQTVADNEQFESQNKGNKMTKLRESEIDQASAIVTANTMVDRLGRWIEELSGMENETLLQLGDSIRDQMGQEQSRQFIETVAPTLQSALETLKTARESVSGAVRSLATGEQPADMLGGDSDLDTGEPSDLDSMNTEPDLDFDEPTDDLGDDDFAAADAASGGVETAGRMKRESIERQNRLLKVLAG